jgi:hypothetical protein
MLKDQHNIAHTEYRSYKLNVDLNNSHDGHGISNKKNNSIPDRPPTPSAVQSEASGYCR